MINQRMEGTYKTLSHKPAYSDAKDLDARGFRQEQ